MYLVKDLLAEHYKDVINDGNCEHIHLLGYLAHKIKSSSGKIDAYHEIGSSKLFSGSRHDTIKYLNTFKDDPKVKAHLKLSKNLNTTELDERRHKIDGTLADFEQSYKNWRKQHV